jgi:DNA-binding LacI/PurR family transcriptional regulator
LASIFDISRITGISKSTVQRVLSGTGSFSEDVAKRVWDTARQLNYQPNGLARAIKTKQSNVIGVIIYRNHMPIISHPFYGPILDSVASELKKHGYGILLLPDSEVTLASGKWLVERRVDGLVLLSQITRDIIDYFKNVSIPFVLVNNSEMVDGVNYIVNDDYQGAYDAACHLIRLGYRRIAYVSGPVKHRSYRLRMQGFQAALREHGLGISQDHIFEGNPVLETGCEAAKQFLSIQPRPDAIFASNDMMAIGVLKEISHTSLRVPNDIALVGFDDIEYSKFTTPELTTVHVDKAAMGRIAAEKLISILTHNHLPPEAIILPTNLVIRESSGYSAYN